MTTAGERSPGWPRHLARVLGILLALQLGVILGLLWSRIGQRAAVAPGPPAGSAGMAPAPPPRAPPSGDRPAGPHRAALLVEVLDGAGRPQRGVAVLASPVDERGRPAGAPRALEPVGELGVLKGRLPLPDEILAGRAPLPEATTLRAVTDERGFARLQGLPVGRLQVQCSHQGQSATAEIVTAAGGPLMARLVLRLGAVAAALAPEGQGPSPDPFSGTGGPGGPPAPALGAVRDVRGQVVDERGLPVARAHIEAQGGDGRQVRRSAGTDSGGRFVLLAVPAGSVRLYLQHPGYAPLVVTPDEEALKGPLRLQLQPGAGIEGVVRERRLGGLPEQLQVTLSSGGVQVPVPIGRDGRFLLTGLPPGEALLRAEAPGYVPLTRRVQLAAAERPDAVTLRDIVLDMELGGTLVGAVRGGARASLRVLDEGGGEVGRGQADAEGRFRIGGLPPGRLHVEARAAAGRAEEAAEVRPGDETRLDLEVR